MKVDSNVSKMLFQQTGGRVKKSKTSNKYLVFTSDGDCHSVNIWLTKNRNFDILVVYYCSENFSEQSHVDFLLRIKVVSFLTFITFIICIKSLFIRMMPS